MTLFMETTQIAPENTIAEINSLLVKAGAKQILTEYGPDKQVSAVCFMLEVKGTPLRFRLPCRWRAVQIILASRSREYKNAWNPQRKEEALKKHEAQARRVAWRIVLRWVQAQLAFVETEMVKTEEVFMSYLQMPNGQTAFEMLEQKGFPQLEMRT